MNYTVVLSMDMGFALVHSIMEIKSHSVSGAERVAIEVAGAAPIPALDGAKKDAKWEIVAVFEGWHQNICSGGLNDPDEEEDQ